MEMKQMQAADICPSDGCVSIIPLYFTAVHELTSGINSEGLLSDTVMPYFISDLCSSCLVVGNFGIFPTWIFFTRFSVCLSGTAI